MGRSYPILPAFSQVHTREQMLLTRKLVLAVGVLASTLTVSLADAGADSPYDLNHSEEWIWVGAGLSLCVGGLIGAHSLPSLTPAEIAAVDRNAINSFDRGTMNPYREDHAGDAMAVSSFLIPLAFLGNDDMREDAETLGAMWAEATLWSEGLAQVTKALAQRNRPYVYDPDAPMEKKTQTEARLSFFSAHATGTAMNCFFMAKVFSDYSDNKNAEVALWTGAVLYPALVGFFRVDSGHHFTTDAIVGLVVGGTIGYLVPALHHRDSGASVAPASNNGGIGFSATFSF
jgi:membrane-associated phospholipid phosphatase